MNIRFDFGRKSAGAASRPQGLRTVPSSNKRAVDSQRRAGRLVGFVFALLGGTALGIWALPTAQRAIASRSWIETPCVILDGQVRRHDGDKGTTYSVDISYRYSIGGEEYHSNAYRVSRSSSSGYATKAAIVRAYPVGSAQVCYVNPEDPTDAILVRGMGLEWFFMLIPLIFFIVGIVVFIGSFRRLPANIDWRGRIEGSGSSEVMVLKSRLSPGMKFVAMILGAAVWNGLVAVFLVIAVRSSQAGDPEWALTLFLIPFVLVGVGLIVGVVHAGLALVNPRCHLRVAPPVLTPGAKASVTWTTRGAVSRMRRLTLHFEGREVVTAHSGKRRRQVVKVLVNIPVAEIQGILEMTQGCAEWEVPSDAPPSFETTDTKIVWVLKVHGDIPNWPDMDEEFAVIVGGEKSGERNPERGNGSDSIPSGTSQA